MSERCFINKVIIKCIVSFVLFKHFDLEPSLFILLYFYFIFTKITWCLNFYESSKYSK